VGGAGDAAAPGVMPVTDAGALVKDLLSNDVAVQLQAVLVLSLARALPGCCGARRLTSAVSRRWPT
jgi:hypothetical protein